MRESVRHRHHRERRRRRHHGASARRHGGAHSRARARRLHRPGRSQLDPTAVWKQLRYRTTDLAGRSGQPFLPYTHYCVGGNTKFWGTVLYRLRREDFRPSSSRRRLAGVADRLRDAGAVTTKRPSGSTTCTDNTAWIQRNRRADHYPRPPAMPHSAGRGGDRRRAAATGPASVAAAAWPAPTGTRRWMPAVSTCNSFPCKVHAKSDAEVCGITPALVTRTFTSGPTRVRVAW